LQDRKGLHPARRKTGKAPDLSFLRRPFGKLTALSLSKGQESMKILDSGSSLE